MRRTWKSIVNGKFCLSLQSQSLIVLLQSTCRHPQRISPFVLAVLKFPVGDRNKKQMSFSKSVWTCIVSVFYSLPIRIRAFFFFSLFLVFFRKWIRAGQSYRNHQYKTGRIHKKENTREEINTFGECLSQHVARFPTGTWQK